MKMLVEFAKPNIGEEEIEAVADVLRSGWVSQGAKVAEFEEAVAAYVGTKHAVAVHSGTAALHVALHLLGVGHGDEVICPAFTCMATANAIRQAGARPVLVDVELDTLNVGRDLVAAAANGRAKAVIVVHQFGLPANMDFIWGMTTCSGLLIIEDAACALGAKYEGQKVGSLGPPTCFSFHPRKVVTTGEGGMVVTDNAELAERARAFRSHGDAVSVLARHEAKGALDSEYPDWGFNYRMTDIQAALGVEQMKRIDEFLTRRREIAARYDEALEMPGYLMVPCVPDYAVHSYQSYMVRVLPGSRLSRDEMAAGLAARGIACRKAPRPLHLEECYREACAGQSFPNAELVAEQGLFLPIHGGMAEKEVEYVVSCIRGILLE